MKRDRRTVIVKDVAKMKDPILMARLKRLDSGDYRIICGKKNCPATLGYARYDSWHGPEEESFWQVLNIPWDTPLDDPDHPGYANLAYLNPGYSDYGGLGYRALVPGHEGVDRIRWHGMRRNPRKKTEQRNARRKALATSYQPDLPCNVYCPTCGERNRVVPPVDTPL